MQVVHLANYNITATENQIALEEMINLHTNAYSLLNLFSNAMRRLCLSSGNNQRNTFGYTY